MRLVCNNVRRSISQCVSCRHFGPDSSATYSISQQPLMWHVLWIFIVERIVHDFGCSSCATIRLHIYLKINCQILVELSVNVHVHQKIDGFYPRWRHYYRRGHVGWSLHSSQYLKKLFVIFGWIVMISGTAILGPRKMNSKSLGCVQHFDLWPNTFKTIDILFIWIALY